MAAERTVRIRFDGTALGLETAAKKARAEMKALEAQTEKNKKKFNDISGSAAGVAKGLALVAVKIAAVAALLNVLPALAGGAIALSGALGLAVGAGMAFAAVQGTMKLGADGIKAAFDKLTPALDTLKAKVSAAFESSLAPAVKNLQGMLPKLTSGFQQIATAIGGVATRTTALLKTPAAIGQLNTILSGTARVVQNLGAFLAPVIAAFVRIGAVAMPILVQLTAGAGAVGERFNAWIQRMADTGNITQWINTAVGAFQQIFHVIGQVGSIFVTVIGTLSDAGLGLGGVIGPVITQIQDFVNSAQGHDTIVALAAAINAIGTAVGQVLGAALKAIASSMPALIDAFSQFTTFLTPVLVTIVQGLGHEFANLATFLAANMTWLAPILAVLLAVTLSLKFLIPIIEGVKAAMAAWEVVQAVLDAELWANPIGVIILAVLALIGIIVLIISNLDFFRGIWDAVWKWVSDVITNVVNWIKGKWDWFWQVFDQMIQNIKDTWNAAWKWVSDVVTRAVDIWKGIIGGAIDGIKGLFRGIGDFVGGIWDGITSGLKSAVNALIRFANMAINGVNRVTGVVGIPAIPNIPMLARGGTAQAGQSYLVGERGPELFTPGQTGRVTDNGQTFAGPSSIELHLDLGEGIAQVFDIQLDRSNRATRRAVLSMAGGTVR